MAIYQSTHTGLEIDNAIDNLNGLSQSVSDLETVVNGLTVSVSELEIIVDGLTQSVEQNTFDINYLESTISGITQSVNSLSYSVYLLDNKVVGLSNSVGSLDNQLQSVSQSVSQNILDINSLNNVKQNKNLYLTNIGVTFSSDTTYANYGYKGIITATGSTPNDFATVVFSHTESISGNYSPVCLTGTNSVTIYSKVNTGVTVSSVIINK